MRVERFNDFKLKCDFNWRVHWKLYHFISFLQKAPEMQETLEFMFKNLQVLPLGTDIWVTCCYTTDGQLFAHKSSLQKKAWHKRGDRISSCVILLPSKTRPMMLSFTNKQEINEYQTKYLITMLWLKISSQKCQFSTLSENHRLRIQYRFPYHWRWSISEILYLLKIMGGKNKSLSFQCITLHRKAPSQGS